MIIALDLGADTGWATYDGGVIESGQQKNKGKTRGARLDAFQEFLTGKISAGDTVIYEDVKRHLGVLAAHAYGAYEGILSMQCHRASAILHAFPVGTIKATACRMTGQPSTKMDKSQMIAAAFKHSGKVMGDDEADAYWLLLTAINPPAESKPKKARKG